MRAGTARNQNDPVDLRALLEELLLQFLRAGDIAQAAERVGAAAGNNVAFAARRRELIGHLLHCLGHVGAARHDRYRLHPQQAKQEMVAAGILLETMGNPLLDHEAAFQAFLDRCGQGDAAMVGLRCATGNECVGALRQCVGHQKLQLAGLVAAGEKSQHVVAFDPDVGTSSPRRQGCQCLREARQKFQRRGAGAVAATGKA